MGSEYGHLTLDERRRMFQLREARQPVALIAATLGRHKSTIYRELRRNFFRGEGPEWQGYFPVTADKVARDRRQRLSKLVARADLRDHVIDRLQVGWSPQQIAGRLGQSADGPGRVCHETIYRFIYGRDGRERDLYRYLAKGRRVRRGRFGRKPRQNAIPNAYWIANRPEQIGQREEFGHWEGDLLIFSRDHGKGNVTTLLERKSRYTLLLANADRRSSAVIGAVQTTLSDLPPAARRSVTFDRGTEFMNYPILARDLSVTSYFCDPHSPWQKGAVENTNGRIRRFLPSEAAPDARTHEALRALAERLNDIPRRCLGYRTPGEVFREHLETIPGIVLQ